MTKDKSIFIKNIYYMLAYAFHTLNQGEFDQIAAEEFDNIHNLFAAILEKGIGRLLKQGLYREYICQKDNIPVLRGKIDIAGSIQNKIAKKPLISCEYDTLSEDNLLNQILKTTVNILIRHGNVEGQYKDTLKKELLFFSDIDIIEPRMIHWSAIRFQRNNATYRILISLCQLLLEGMLLTTDDGEYRLAEYVDDQQMSRLYEKFILEYYVKERPELKAAASQIPWALEEGTGTFLPSMQTDIMLTKGNRTLIIDAKYYSRTMQVQYDRYSIHSNNLYQIFTYVKNKDSEYSDKKHDVAGMLLYAQTDEAIQPDEKYKISGNWISVSTLDLNKDFSNIAEKLNNIADRI